MHLETIPVAAPAPVILGCRQVETGDFLDVGPVNGLLGLGYGALLDVTSLLYIVPMGWFGTHSRCVSHQTALITTYR
ncbi:unnamed protein product [Cuscuta campestris]|uniref:Uncharacterized protein n=1 Tax=Cuscuta campestris TaxID=132261 RepID=A0A484LE45_9ASTE|nr:unnamed protein product [Cuscuta campestris]